MLHNRAIDPKAASEVSASFEIREVGRVQSVRKFIVIATDLPSCINGQIVRSEEHTSELQSQR